MVSVITLSSLLAQSTEHEVEDSSLSQTPLPHRLVGANVGNLVGGEGFFVGEGVVGTGTSVGSTVMHDEARPKQLSLGPFGMTM